VQYFGWEGSEGAREEGSDEVGGYERI